MFEKRLKQLIKEHQNLVERKNEPELPGNGIFTRYKYPVITADHTPLFWRYDLNRETNPSLMERQGVEGAYNPGAIFWQGKYCMVVRVEGADRKSFFAIAESDTGVDNFTYRQKPLVIDETHDPDVNVYDMRLVEHEDGYIYGIFCTERKDPQAPEGDTSSAVAQCGIVRTKDLDTWDRLPDLKTPSPQQRNVVLHPEFIDGKYAFYTRPQDGFISTGKGGGIGWGLSDSMNPAVVESESLVDLKAYHTIKEVKNGEGPAPIKTDRGWIHLAHGVRECAAGLRYVLYLYMTDLEKPWVVNHSPGGYFMAPQGEERVGDVSNVLFANGWIQDDQGRVFIYYASSDTRCHVAVSTVDQLLDYCLNTPEDGLRSAKSVEQRIELIESNLALELSDPLLKKALL
jgi:4-O-beta-D-mannosyl-D-glucose phosphorylase